MVMKPAILLVSGIPLFSMAMFLYAVFPLKPILDDEGRPIPTRALGTALTWMITRSQTGV
jgi:hypothetical protein